MVVARRTMFYREHRSPWQHSTVHKSRCSECVWTGTDFLIAKNPFNEKQEIFGCPSCGEVNSIVMACDVLDCWNSATCEWTDDGLVDRHTCGQHMDEAARSALAPERK